MPLSVHLTDLPTYLPCLPTYHVDGMAWQAGGLEPDAVIALYPAVWGDGQTSSAAAAATDTTEVGRYVCMYVCM